MIIDLYKNTIKIWEKIYDGSKSIFWKIIRNSDDPKKMRSFIDTGIEILQMNII